MIVGSLTISFKDGHYRVEEVVSSFGVYYTWPLYFATKEEAEQTILEAGFEPSMDPDWFVKRKVDV